MKIEAAVIFLIFAVPPGSLRDISESSNFFCCEFLHMQDLGYLHLQFLVQPAILRQAKCCPAGMRERMGTQGGHETGGHAAQICH